MKGAIEVARLIQGKSQTDGPSVHILNLAICFLSVSCMKNAKKHFRTPTKNAIRSSYGGY